MLRQKFFWIGIYPIIAHFGLWVSQPRLAVGYLVGLLLFILLFPPRCLQFKNIGIASLVVVSTTYLFVYDLDYILVYFPPIFIPIVLMLVFMQSLRHKNVPLITQFATKMEGSLDDERKLYTKRVTQLWTVVFAFMVLEAIFLAIWSSVYVWSWFTHIGNYIVIALTLAIEFIYRKYRFKTKNNFKVFISKLIQHSWT